MFDLSGRVALVTGAGQNVGEGIARALAGRGATVAVNDLDPGRAVAVAEQIRTAGGDADPVPFDVTDGAAVRAAVDGLGRVDVLVNNAGNAGAQPMLPSPFRATSPAAWVAPIQVNLYGVLHCTHAVVDGMCERGWGRVITISSAAATAGGDIGVSAYSAGKGAGMAFTRTLALEVARHGVTANTLAIGLMGLPDPDLTAAFAAAIPVGRTGTPDDVGAACVWLASEEASWLTGQTVQLNGGMVTT